MIVNWSIIIHRVGLMAGIAIATTVGILSEWMQRNHSKLVSNEISFGMNSFDAILYC